MDITIRKVELSDLKEISKLFKDEKTEEELKWTYFFRINKTTYNSFVAEHKKYGIVGIIGYMINSYRFKSHHFTGVIPIGWEVAKKFRGLLGVQLLLKVIKLADFGFTIGGTKMALKSQTLAKVKLKLEGYLYYKIIDPLYYIKLKDDPYPIRVAKSFFHVFEILRPKRFKPGSLNVRLEKIDFSQTVEIQYEIPVLHNIHSWDYIQWLLDCPLVEMYAWLLFVENSLRGIVICNVKKIQDNVTRGRIVYVPYFGEEDEVWLCVIRKVEQFLISKKCSIITTMSLNHEYSRILQQMHYRIGNKKMTLFLRDDNNILQEIHDDQWYLTFSESDKSARKP